MVRIPSTQALRALDSFARHRSVWQAASELNLTRSAVSHQLRLLERDLGFRLLNRVGTRVELTPQGRAYADDVRQALAAIAGSASRNAGRGVSGPLTVSSTAGFASAWLCPRIGRFRATCPDVALSIVTPRRVDDVSNPEADVFVAFGRAGLDGAELLREVAFTPLCSPALINRLGGLSDPADVLRAGLLHLHDTADWRGWFRLARLDEADAAAGIAFSDVNLVYAAALGGQGIAMGDEFICHEAMVAGRLVRPFDLAVPSAQAYRLLVPPARAGNPAVEAFCRWLRSELSDSPA
jgi:LysR family glycine cleavage system transcriptional activator